MKYTDIDYNLNTKNKDIILSEDIEAIKNSIRNIVTINKYSIPGNPEFGSDIYGMLFEPNDILTYDLIEDILREEIEQREPRVIVQEISFTTDSVNNRVIVYINVNIVNTDELSTIVIKL